MTATNRTPIYNMNAMLQETGLSADVIRVWEKRYQLPKPGRSAGGHRLYSQYDIELVKWLRARQLEGLSISRAVELWRDRVAAGQDPLGEAASEVVSVVEPLLPADTRIKVLRNHWLDACLAFDGQSCRRPAQPGDRFVPHRNRLYRGAAMGIEIPRRPVVCR